MRRNRKVPKKMSVVATNSMRFGAIIVFFFVMVILNMLSSSSCTQLFKVQGELEREIAKLEDSRMRESTRWEEMMTPEKVEMALNRHCLAMRTPQAKQNVKMLPDGRPRPGQLALKRMKMRLGDPLVEANPVRLPSPARTSYRRLRSR